MTSDNPPPVRASRWKAPPGPAGSPGGRGNYRSAFRLLGLPVLGVAAAYLFYGLQDYLSLPKCDSDRAKKTLGEVLKQLDFEPVRFEPMTTVSSSKDQVVCNAVLPLPDGATVVIDYSFTWEGSKANMRYSISRRAPGSPADTSPPSPPSAPSPPLSLPSPTPPGGG
jgi:hypothetical protein